MLPSSLGYAHARRTLDMAGKGTFKREDYTATGRRLSCGLLLLLAEMAGVVPTICLNRLVNWAWSQKPV